MNRKIHFLEYGTVLDERYIIHEVLGEGGFGITYSGENSKIGLKVAIKEFFCRDYMGRNTSESEEVFLKDEEMSERFLKEKNRFLKEARTLSDFSSEDGIVHVIDYFEANNTAYIVMGFLNGMTLKEHVRLNGPMESGVLFEKIKPLLKTLEKLHEAGLLHRDISPDNIMLLENGSLCLIDFGAALHFDISEKSYSIITKRNYSAPELYNNSSDLTGSCDIYSLCATIYYCISAAEPEDALARVLIDELAMPSSLGTDISPDAERIIMKGLALRPDERWPDSASMLDAVYGAFPEKTKEGALKSRKKILVFAGALTVIAICAALFFILYWPHRIELRLKNVPTEVIYLYTTNEMTAQEYNISKEVVRSRLQILAGRDNYLWEELDDKICVELPISVLKGEDPAFITRAFLSRPYNLYLLGEPSTDMEGVRQNSMALLREDMEKCELLTGEAEGADRTEYGLPESGDYRYFRITLTEEAAQRFNTGHYDPSYNDLLNIRGSEFTLWFDIFEENVSEYYSSSAISLGDGRSFYLLCRLQEGNFIDVLYYSLSHDPSRKCFSVLAMPIVSWEDPSSSFTAGKEQVNAEEISGPYYTLIYDFSYVSADEKASWIHNMIAFKDRLDVLKIPYAFGLLDYDNSCFVLKAEKSSVYKEAFEYLAGYCSNSLDLYTKWINVGTFDLETAFIDTDAKTFTLSPISNFGISDTDREAYLFWGKYPLARISTDDLMEFGELNDIVFHNHNFFFEFDPEFLEYIRFCGQENMDSSGSLSYIYLNDDESGLFEAVPIADLPCIIQDSIYPGQEELKEKVSSFAENIGCSVTFGSNDRSGLISDFWFFDVDKEDITETALKSVETVIDELTEPINSGEFDSLLLYFSINGSEDDTSYERLGIYITKSHNESRMSLSAIYNQNLGLDDNRLLDEVTEYFNNHPALKDIDTKSVSVYN